MNNELISIIIPVYNSEKYIERCIESVLNQTYQNIEIVIVNDGSIDSSEALIEKYLDKDKRIIIINQKNCGVSAARNNGIKKSSGKYITFIDSDDYYEDDAIETLYNCIKKTNCDLVRGNYRVIKNKKVIEEGNVVPGKINDFYDLYNKIFDNSIPSYSVLLLIKKDFIFNNNIFFDENIAMMEDTIFYINILSKYPNIYFDNKIIYNYEYNQSGASKSSKYYERNMYNTISVNNKIKILLNGRKYDITKLNSNSYNIIVNYLFSLYCILEKKHWEKILKTITKNADLIEIEKNIKYKKSPHYFLGELFLKNRKLLLLKLFFFVRSRFVKLRGE